MSSLGFPGQVNREEVEHYLKNQMHSIYLKSIDNILNSSLNDLDFMLHGQEIITQYYSPPITKHGLLQQVIF